LCVLQPKPWVRKAVAGALIWRKVAVQRVLNWRRQRWMRLKQKSLVKR
jgi:hypothetical protein